jgi:hypothetical protein
MAEDTAATADGNATADGAATKRRRPRRRATAPITDTAGRVTPAAEQPPSIHAEPEHQPTAQAPSKAPTRATTKAPTKAATKAPTKRGAGNTTAGAQTASRKGSGAAQRPPSTVVGGGASHDGGHGGSDQWQASSAWRDLVGNGPSKLTLSAALRARDLDRPSAQDMARAEAEVVLVRRPSLDGDRKRAPLPTNESAASTGRRRKKR